MKPSNPLNILIKNQFYPKGLTEIELYNFWQKQKDIILKNTSSEVFFFFSNKLNESVIKRHNTSDNFIKLNSINYDKLITSHIVGIISTMDKRSKFGIVDIDSPKIDEISSSSEFNEIKQATQKVFDYFSKFNKCQIYYTGKNGFHVYVYFDRSMSPDQIKSYLTNRINENKDLLLDYTFQSKRTDSKINLDLSPNKKSGGYITPGSINKIGLICTNVKNLQSFNREDCKIN